MNTIIAHNNDTEGNSELIDIRSGQDGITYTSAGNAVRSQTANLNNTLNTYKNLITPIINTQYLSEDNRSNGFLWNYTAGNIIKQANVNFCTYEPIYLKIGSYTTTKIFIGQSYVLKPNGTFVKADVYFSNILDDPNYFTGVFDLTENITFYPTFQISHYSGSYPMIYDGETPIDNVSGVYKITGNPIVEINNVKLGKLAENYYDFSDYKLAYIKNKRLTFNPIDGAQTALYTGIDLGTGNRSKKVKCKVIFYHQKTNSPIICLISNPNGIKSVLNIINGSIHVCFGVSSYHIDFWENNVYHQRIFEGSYTPCTVDDTTEYEFGYELNGDTITLYLPDNTTVSHTDTRFNTYNGRYVIYEHYISNVNYDSFTYFDYKYIEASKNNDTKPCFYDDFDRSDGIIGISPLGYTYSQFKTNDTGWVQ